MFRCSASVIVPAPVTKTPHDALFKSVFQQPENAAAELQHVLSAEHVSAIDWSSLKLEPGSYVDEKLADQHSDLLFSANAQASGERVFVDLLFEHQSTPEPRMALRLDRAWGDASGTTATGGGWTREGRISIATREISRLGGVRVTVADRCRGPCSPSLEPTTRPFPRGRTPKAPRSPRSCSPRTRPWRRPAPTRGAEVFRALSSPGGTALSPRLHLHQN